MEDRKFKLEVKNGCIKITPRNDHYSMIAENIANQIAEGATTEWHKTCLIVMNALADNADYFRDSIMQNVSYSNHFYPKSMEQVKGKSFESAKNYIEGYTDAVIVFKETFDNTDCNFREALNKILPTY